MDYFYNVMGTKRNIKAFINMLKGRFFSTPQHPKPFFLSHMLTNKCNCDCGFCYWKYPVPGELSTDEVISLYHEAAKLGFAHLSIWGGEPLMRKDVVEVAKHARESGLLVTVVTNGYYLPEKIEIANYIDTMAVSIDAPVPELHDKIRKRKGCFERAIKGLDLLIKYFPGVKRRIDCVVHKTNVDYLEDMCRLAERYNALIYFCPVGKIESIDGWKGEEVVKSLSLSREELQEIYRQILGYKKAGYPVANSEFMLRYFIEGQPGFPCFLPRTYLYVYSNGDVESCFLGKFANLRERSLKEILDSNELKEIVHKSTTCNISCPASEAIESSGLWQWKWSSLKQWLLE